METLAQLFTIIAGIAAIVVAAVALEGMDIWKRQIAVGKKLELIDELMQGVWKFDEVARSIARFLFNAQEKNYKNLSEGDIEREMEKLDLTRNRLKDLETQAKHLFPDVDPEGVLAYVETTYDELHRAADWGENEWVSCEKGEEPPKENRFANTLLFGSPFDTERTLGKENAENVFLSLKAQYLADEPTTPKPPPESTHDRKTDQSS